MAHRPVDSDGGTVRAPTGRAALTVARSRGAGTGLLLIVLGAWGVLLPMIGPHFHFGYGPDGSTFHLTAARFWLQVLPGIVAFVAGLLLLVGANRVTGLAAAYIGCAAGAWFVVGPTLANLRTHGYVGVALGSSDRQQLDAIAAFIGLGAVIVFFAALAAGRLSVIGVRDVRAAERRQRNRADARDEVVTGEPATTGYEPVAEPIHDDTVTRPVEPVAYPATREVPATTTSIRPAAAEPVERPGAVREGEDG